MGKFSKIKDKKYLKVFMAEFIVNIQSVICFKSTKVICTEN